MINRPVAQRHQKGILSALEEYMGKNGLNVRHSSVRYGDDSEMRIAIDIAEVFPESEDARMELFNESCGEYGFDPSHYGKTFLFEGKEYRLVGFNDKSPLYCLRTELVRTGWSRTIPLEDNTKKIIVGG